MAKQETVTVELIKNPSVKRQMTAQSARLNSRKWRVINSPVAVETKKKDVNPVADKPKNPASIPNDVPNDLDGGGEFAKIASEKETLQEEYEEKSGQKPDGRWNEAKLKLKIAGLNQTNNETA